MTLRTCGHWLILITFAAFYLIDATQFDGGAPPATLEAVTITRYGIIKGWGYGHRANSKAKGAVSQVTVTRGAIYETLKVDPEWWKEKGGDSVEKEHDEKQPLRNCTSSPSIQH